MGEDGMIYTVFKWSDGCDDSINWNDFIDGLKDGRFLIVEHTIEFDKCSHNSLQEIVVKRNIIFDIVKEWKQRNSQLIECRLSDYNVYLKYDDGLMVISDKGVLVSIERIKNALNIQDVPTSEIPFISLGVGNCTVENTIIINMTKLLKVVREYKCC